MLCQRGGEFDVVKILGFGLAKERGERPHDIVVILEVLAAMHPWNQRDAAAWWARADARATS